MKVRYPNCVVQLTGRDGNIFSVIARVRVALRTHLTTEGMSARAANRYLDEFTAEVMAATSYDDALRVAMAWVTTE